jgi:hypothetical protein
MIVDNNSSFIDIGSGFGKPVFHSAIQTGCPSYGIEVVPARVAFTLDRKFIFADEIARRNKVISERSAH